MVLPGWVCESTDRSCATDRPRVWNGALQSFRTGLLSLQTAPAIYARDVLGDENDMILTTVLGPEATFAAQGG